MSFGSWRFDPLCCVWILVTNSNTSVTAKCQKTTNNKYSKFMFFFRKWQLKCCAVIIHSKFSNQHTGYTHADRLYTHRQAIYTQTGYTHADRLYTHRQAIHTQTGYTHTDRLYTRRQAIHTQTGYTHTDRLYTRRQAIHTQTGCTHTDRLYTRRQAVHTQTGYNKPNWTSSTCLKQMEWNWFRHENRQH